MARTALNGAGGTLVFNEVPSGTVDGNNTVFTLLNTPISLLLFVNGQLFQGGGTDYTLSGLTITFVTAPPINSIILALYTY